MTKVQNNEAAAKEVTAPQKQTKSRVQFKQLGESVYEVSASGKVRNIDTGKELSVKDGRVHLSGAMKGHHAVADLAIQAGWEKKRPQGKPVKGTIPGTDMEMYFYSAMEACRLTGSKSAAVHSAICRGHKSAGMYWEYVEGEELAALKDEDFTTESMVGLWEDLNEEPEKTEEEASEEQTA